MILVGLPRMKGNGTPSPGTVAPHSGEEIELCGYRLDRYCPHRQADLSVFGEVDGDILTCTLHGWQFDLKSGECLTATGNTLRVRPATS